MKSTDHYCARKCAHVYWFIDDLTATDDDKEFENSLKEIRLVGLELKKENANCNVTAFLDLRITIKEGKLLMKLYDKRDGFKFFMARLPYKYSNIRVVIFYSTIPKNIEFLEQYISTMILR